ncbi:hypothetical protein [Yoonia sp. 208BN28-4]|uniref:hypothetical protein n=1 Tax=Yoonia sp. 208BN28-4 TaxID=3126505 RepID=UPI0030B79F0A
MFTDPEIISGIMQIALSLLGIAGTIAAAKFTQRTGIQIEQVHIDRIKGAIAHVALSAMADGKTDLREITRLSTEYLKAQMPDAVARVRPSQSAIETIARASVARARDAAGRLP